MILLTCREPKPSQEKNSVMPKGVSTKGYKMTENRRNILELLVGEGGTLKSAEGKATSLMHGLLDNGSSVVALNASLRELENIGFVDRDIEGRRTFAITITDQGRGAIGAEREPEPPALEEPTGAANGQSASPPQETNGQHSPTGPVSEDQWDWKVEQDKISIGEISADSIDYDVLLGVFLKAALRGMEGPSHNELAFYKQQNETLAHKIEALEEEVNKFRAEAAHAIAERDQLQKNLNIIMSKSESKGTRGSDPIRRLLSADERAALDALMRQMPRTSGE